MITRKVKTVYSVKALPPPILPPSVTSVNALPCALYDTFCSPVSWTDHCNSAKNRRTLWDSSLHLIKHHSCHSLISVENKLQDLSKTGA